MEYITLEELATIIAANRPDLEVASEDVEQAHIEFATSHLNTVNWIGNRASSTQANAWPRSYVPIDKFDRSLGNRDNSVIPSEIKLIAAELAVRFASTPSITNSSASGIAVTGVTLPDSEFDILGDYISDAIQQFLKTPSGSLYRAN